jgi:hypothetical protein
LVVVVEPEVPLTGTSSCRSTRSLETDGSEAGGSGINGGGRRIGESERRSDTSPDAAGLGIADEPRDDLECRERCDGGATVAPAVEFVAGAFADVF